MMQVNVSIHSHIGKVRQCNEDNFYFNGLSLPIDNKGEEFVYSGVTDLETALIAIFDGMGGESDGEIASGLSSAYSKKLHVELKETEFDMSKLVYNHVVNAHYNFLNQVMSKVTKENGIRRMGTTVSGVYFCHNTAYIHSAGDSRIYLIREGTITCLTRDHTEAQMLIDLGVLDEITAKRHRSGNKLTRYLGDFEHGVDFEADIVEPLYMLKDDILMLCSDGLTDLVFDNEILECISATAQLNESSESLLQLALNRGGKDNVTIVLVQINE